MPRYTPASLTAVGESAAQEMTPELLASLARAMRSLDDRHSLRNRFLMWAQNHDVRQVGTFKFWRERGRRVRRGEQGLAILAPITRTKDDQDVSREAGQPTHGADVATSEAARRLRACKVMYVWDVSQTEPIEACTECGAAAGEECCSCTSNQDEGGPVSAGLSPEELAELVNDFMPAPAPAPAPAEAGHAGPRRAAGQDEADEADEAEDAELIAELLA
ncbi:ArdC-like ssDNA-binding domain-containing protein [Nonomuraea sp. NPDC050536]|uniref:ArdC-like ssDNA-binding domain-containing protein n=1 Tax=Nonomuraea sp. NPDC050536 TaxID=3364366 RepID=UPI0037C5EF0F